MATKSSPATSVPPCPVASLFTAIIHRDDRMPWITFALFIRIDSALSDGMRPSSLSGIFLIAIALTTSFTACTTAPQPPEAIYSSAKWEKEIAALEARDRTNPPPRDGIVFVGSSSIKRWTNLAQAFPGKPVINHGFGGSQICDSVAYAERIVIPQRPRLVVLYAGGNDINAGKTPETVFNDFKAFVKKVHAALPQTRIAFISSAPNPKRWEQVEKVKRLNQLAAAYISGDPRLTFINVFPHMLGADGQPKPDIYVADRLHMNDKGYAIWTEIIGPYLK